MTRRTVSTNDRPGAIPGGMSLASVGTSEPVANLDECLAVGQVRGMILPSQDGTREHIKEDAMTDRDLTPEDRLPEELPRFVGGDEFEDAWWPFEDDDDSPDPDEFGIAKSDDLHLLERAYVGAIRRMEDYEQGRRPDYSGHCWHGAANDAHAALKRIEELGLFREAGFGDMEQYVERRLVGLFEAPAATGQSGYGA